MKVEWLVSVNSAFSMPCEGTDIEYREDDGDHHQQDAKEDQGDLGEDPRGVQGCMEGEDSRKVADDPERSKRRDHHPSYINQYIVLVLGLLFDLQ